MVYNDHLFLWYVDKCLLTTIPIPLAAVMSLAVFVTSLDLPVEHCHQRVVPYYYWHTGHFVLCIHCHLSHPALCPVVLSRQWLCLCLSHWKPDSHSSPCSLYRESLNQLFQSFSKLTIFSHYIFQVCGKAFTCAAELSRHGKCHLGGSMYTCAVCFHVFANAASLERHMKRHATDKPYGCTVCGKSFARKEHLDNHTRCHTGETPYRCQYCAKTFTRKEHMVNHVRKHTGETPHRCDICKKSFTRKEHFMNHVMWHTGETPHACQVCIDCLKISQMSFKQIRVKP